ncbi:alpha/beta hydrolase [Streptomyces avidinii]|uniref:alpha/beta fold hydrolase n=1 Tax=Streptomyces avidinii TaxID=1895 RepID=UPI003867709C|nr:alpha/beta hydrolase [Streptomyces avidinii]
MVAVLVVEDIGAVVDIDTAFTRRLPGPQPTREALAQALGTAAPYLECSFRQKDDGWGFSFDIDDTIASQQALTGDHWADWTGLTCPTLLVHGTRSDEITPAHAREMHARHPGPVHRVELSAGHVVHHDALDDFANALRAFLAT